MPDLGPFELDTIVVGDCLDVMRQMPDGCVDAVITDPPYGIGMFQGDTEQWGFLDDIHRILADDALLYVFCGDTCYVNARLAFEAIFTFRRTLIWERAVGHGGNDFQLCHEYILYGWKGKPEIDRPMRQATSQASLRLGRTTVGEKTVLRTPSFNSTTSERCGHPTQKPEALLEKLAGTVSVPAIIFDPFMGSGTTAVAAKNLGRHYFGCDINPEYVELARQRVAKVDGVQLELI